jgi:cation diffusion facilitator CzcD-associated flavoprotein CzcO
MSTAADTDLDQVVAVATDYLTSFYEGSAEERAARIERVIHPHLAKCSPAWLEDDGAAFFEWTFPAMIEGAAISVDDDNATVPYSLRVLDMSPRMASVRTDAVWGVDYLHLA